MSTATLVPEEIQATHQNRPTPKLMLPFWVNKEFFPTIGWEQFVKLPTGEDRVMRMATIIKGNPVMEKILSMIDIYHEVAGRVDGLLAAVDKLTTDNLLLQREVEKLTNQLAESKRSNGKKNS